MLIGHSFDSQLRAIVVKKFEVKNKRQVFRHDKQQEKRNNVLF